MEYKELVKQWEPVNMDFFKKLVQLHNAISLEKKSDNEFSDFVLSNKEKFNNPDYLQIFAEWVEITDEFFDEHIELCKFVHQFMKDNSDWTRLNFGLKTHIRLGMFEDLFEEYLRGVENE